MKKLAFYIVFSVHGCISKSFWDMGIRGQAISAGGTRKTTAEMRTAGTFLDAGWDFVDETANGMEDIWLDSRRPGLSAPVVGTSQMTIDY